MTDWDEMVQNIRNAMEALEQAERASKTLQEAANHGNFEVFRSKMAVLEEHLRKLKTVLNHEGAFAADELMDALSRVFTGHGANHRRTPRMET
jgi:hypothetical protein